MKLILYILVFAPIMGLGQIEIDNKIILTSQNDSLRQIENATTATNNASPINNNDYINSTYIYCTAITLSDTIFLTNQYSGNYINGMQLFFKADTSISKNCFVKLNNLSTEKLVKYTLDTLAPGIISKNKIISIIYNLDQFQILNQNQNECPEGFRSINESYCIENNENIPDQYYDAVISCRAKNARLCSWNEWYYACSQNNTSLNNMTNNFEWIGDAANENYQIKIVGNNSCTSNNVGLTSGTQTYNYRCCYSK